MLLALAFGFAAATAPHVELPSTFSGDRLFVMPRVAQSTRRLALWVDTNGSGFLRSGIVKALHLQNDAMRSAYLPRLDEVAFPPVTGNRGALPVLNDSEVANDPIFAGVDGQLGWTWLADRIWTIDYIGHHFYLDRAAPNYPGASRVSLVFDRAHRYPMMDVTIDGKTYRAALDTAATVALSERTATSLNDGMPLVRATSFIRKRTLDSWHAAHPEWRYIADAGFSPGVSLIQIPEVRAGRVTFRDVWFSTRPDDDVFQGDAVDAKLGPTAFRRCTVTIDYVHDAAGFEC
jgi:hypothetical protein